MCSSAFTFSITSSTLSLSPLKPSFQSSTKCHFRTSSLTGLNGYVCLRSTYCHCLTHTPVVGQSQNMDTSHPRPPTHHENHSTIRQCEFVWVTERGHDPLGPRFCCCTLGHS
jgi:hypothetical protein